MNNKELIKNYFPTVVLVAATTFFLYDIITDVMKGNESTAHLTIEALIFLFTSIILAYEVLRVIRLRENLTYEQEKVARLSGDLSEIINKDFDEWKLTNSEKDVAIMLIKGYSMNEIANLRNVKEKTVRQQATSIYAKSKCANRHELAAKFIEDLLNT